MYIDVSLAPYSANQLGTADARTAFANADAAGGTLYVPRGIYRIDSNLTLSSDIHFEEGAVIRPNAGVTVTLNGYLDAGRFQVFDITTFSASTVTPTKVEYMIPEWWGAGGGSADDFIAAALTAAAGVGVVRLGAGNYVVESSLELPSGTRLLGQGQALTTLTLGASDGMVPVLMSSNELGTIDLVEVAHLTIDGNRGGVSGSSGDGNAMGIRMAGWKNAHVHHVTVRNCHTDGIYFGLSGGGGCENVWVTDCEVTNCRRNNISVVDCRGGGIARTTCNGANGTAPASGIDIEPSEDETVRDFVVEACTANDNHAVGILVTLTQTGVVSNLELRGNTCRGNGIGIGTASPGIRISRVSGVQVIGNRCTVNTTHGIEVFATSVLNADNNVLSGNSCTLNSQNGIFLEHAQGNVVTGNHCSSNAQFGIQLNGDTCKYNSLTGNVCASNTLRGIYLFAATHNTVTGNHCHLNGTDGIALRGAASHNTVASNQVAENSQTTDNTSDGILIDTNSDYNNVQGNTVRMVSATKRHRHAIRVNTADCGGNLVTNNDLYAGGQTTAGLSDAGTGTVTAAGNR